MFMLLNFTRFLFDVIKRNGVLNSTTWSLQLVIDDDIYIDFKLMRIFSWLFKLMLFWWLRILVDPICSIFSYLSRAANPKFLNRLKPVIFGNSSLISRDNLDTQLNKNDWLPIKKYCAVLLSLFISFPSKLHHLQQLRHKSAKINQILVSKQ